MCITIFELIGQGPEEKDSDKRGIYIFDLVILLPVLVFIALDQPHDCFMCLGKDPDHEFSIYQLTYEERAIRKMKAKFSENSAEWSCLNDAKLIKLSLTHKKSRRTYTEINLNKLVHSDEDDVRCEIVNTNG